MHTIFTNNSSVADFFKQKKEFDCTVKWVAAPAMDVLSAARLLIRQGAALASNPLVGVNLPTKQATPRNTRPPLFPTQQSSAIFNPYLTIITSAPGEAVDFQSLKKIDEAITVYKKNAKLRFAAHTDDAIAHFQMIDMRCMLQSLSVIFNVKAD
ncbi:MAG: hypothetical protein FWC71_00705 [Defluviitaleaceae bacterium]|nr:hypothetical protein [Defluviitaleaceae bacterium]